jgi:hypothetical protein
MAPANWTLCPAGIWTHISSLPAPFTHVNFWSRSGSVSVRWRRYMETSPFHTDGTATLREGQNIWVVPPAAGNTWWFNPQRACELRLT